MQTTDMAAASMGASADAIALPKVPRVRILTGDCRDLMRAMAEASVDTIVTDPPYDLTSARPGGRSPATEGAVMKGFMGMEWDGSGVAFDPDTWRESLRVLKPGGHLLAFGGSRTYHRLACAIEDAGFEIRDQIMWLYGSGFPKGGNRDGIGTCLKPAHEPIVMARKPCVGSARSNIAKLGTGGLNIDACRIHGPDAQGGAYTVKRLKPGATLDKTGGNWRPEEGGVEYHGEMKPGRWPANVIHDGSDAVFDAFPYTKSGHLPAETLRGATGGPGGKYGLRAAVTGPEFEANEGSAARFFYCAKASKADRDEGLDAFAPQQFVQFQTGNGESGEASSLSEGRSTVYRNIHPTVKPEALMRYLVRLVAPAGGTVLDPFMGSGSTGKAAVLEGFDFIGCEMTEKYVPIAEARIAAARQRFRAAAIIDPRLSQGDLFGDAA